MKSRAHDPLRLDVAALTSAGESLAGEWPASALPRWAESQQAPQDLALSTVSWQVQGERRPVAGGEAEIWLHLKAQARQWLTCQRCLQPYDEPVAVDCRIRFVRGESQAEALDAEIEEDVLALSRSLDLRELVEDELLLAMPLVPRHEACPQPLQVAMGDAPALPPAAQASAPEAKPNPFAVLQSLKRRDPG